MGGGASKQISPLGQSHGHWARFHQGLMDKEKTQNYAEALHERNVLRQQQRKDNEKKQILNFLTDAGWDFSNMPKD